MERFVGSMECRQHQVCKHFGEQPKWERCGTCDICAGAPDWLEVEATRSRGRRAKGSQTRTEKRTAGEARTAVATLSVLDAQLREYLREWRRDTARDAGGAAIVLLRDTALDALCAAEPSTFTTARGGAGLR